MTEKKSKAGRHSKFNPEQLEEIERMAGIGLPEKDIAYILGISEKTLYNWKKNFPEFLQAIKRGRIQGKMIIVNSLFQKARNGNVTAMIFWLVNRFPEEWRNLHQIEAKGSGFGNVEIHIHDAKEGKDGKD